MSDDEAYEKLAVLVRVAMSARKIELYRELRDIEQYDELRGYELVRAAGEKFWVEVGEHRIRATREQPDAFKIYSHNSEWRAYIDEVKRLLE